MAFALNAERLIDNFAETDPRIPLLVFSLLSLYLEQGPFEFDAGALSRRLATLKLKARLNPEEIAALQPQLERFFAQQANGWTPKDEFLTASPP